MTNYRRRHAPISRGDRSMQALVGLFFFALLAALLGLAAADWMTGYDTLASGVRTIRAVLTCALSLQGVANGTPGVCP